ncbi:phage tail sheath family protein [Adhaeribacter rhizoryzae]|uniref:Phage tail sheath family protein n=2 Tax=Adhaeribacter rhizoryzae TaxID=2607907 RepID=A0A5M6DQD7_9BACT|nr:phage tail sheath family protein [Adhaeribacter rhizoryzae]
MHFSNGGGKCYIISLGEYPDPFVAGDLINGITDALAELRKEDDPTLILFPDGIKLNPAQLGALHSLALMQCENLKDRFLVADVIIANPADDRYRKTDIDAFRTAVGMGNLNFGAAYYPYLRVNIPRQVKYRDVKDKVRKLGANVDWAASFIDPADVVTLNSFNALNDLVASSTAIDAQLKSFLGTNASLEAMYLARKADFYNTLSAVPDVANISTADFNILKTAYREIWNFQYTLVHDFLDEFVRDTGTPKLTGSLLTELRTALQGQLTAPAPNFFSPLFNVDKISQDNANLNPAAPANDPMHTPAGRTWNFAAFATAIGAIGPADPTGLVLTPAGGNNAGGRQAAANNMLEIVNKRADEIFYSLYTTVTNVYRDASTKEAAIETEVLRRIPVLAGVINYIRAESFLLPPSGAVSGLYARVDNTKFVWKAPANESLINVIAPSVKLELTQNDELNVDVNFGKSINVIRAFVGKGTLVWGARTLAGNDNEWRYVSVRRFFNMVEESCRKATKQFVFESNDANTWVKVQAMIENFLTTLWRQGALQGAVTDHAFYVAVGLGKTMTPLDILEGRMIVEIGLAVVRPAEFIVLRFSHKMPES